MSTTLTMALIVGATAYIANVGDSRSYLWNADGLQRITHDHSLVQRLVDAGEITAEEVYTHPQRNLIYQSIGDRPAVAGGYLSADVAVDDRLVLCSDGLWEMVHDDGPGRGAAVRAGPPTSVRSVGAERQPRRR
jgi:serine/threonine protein phosphatase PrpC